VRAVNSGGESPDSTQVSATPKAAAAAAPTGLTATAGDAKVDLRWTAVTGATGYNVYRSTTTGSFGTTPVNANPVTAASFSDTGLTNGTKYFYIVRAVNAGGESASSAEVSATPVAPAPGAPTGLTATAGDAKVDLKWTAETSATTYNVYRSTGGGALARIGSPTPATGTTLTDSTAANGTTYTYAVRAVNANGESANSNTVTATPTAAAAPGTFTFAPAADVYVSQASPTTAFNGSELQAVGGTTSAKQSFLRFTVSGLPAGATVSSAKLRLFVTNDSTNGGVFNTITNTTFTETTTWNTKPAIDGPQVGSLGAVALNTFQEITLPAGTVTGNGTVSFAMRLPATVTNTLGYASRSNATVANRPQLIVTTGAGASQPPATVPAAPTGLAATAGNAQVGLSWNAVAGATGYNVYRSTTSGSFGTTPVNATPLTSASFTNTGLTNGTQYFFVVRAVNASGQSPSSTQVAATPAAPPAGATFTFAPAADVFVSQASPTAAFNGSELQAVGGTTSAKQSFLRFTVSGLPVGATVSSAKLRLFVTNDSTNGGVFNTITNTTFTETATWNTKPAIDGPQVGSLGAVALNTFQEITLPAGTVKGNGTVSFAMQVPAAVTNTLGYASRNNTTVANRPQLIVTT
jgi:fibronectin type 3 domain-containing protein